MLICYSGIMKTAMCPFCIENNLLESEMLFEDDLWYFAAMKEGAIQNAGMAITKRHIETPFEINEEEWIRLRDLLPSFRNILDVDSPTGYNIGWNVYSSGGQHVQHAHLHIIARYDDEPLAGKGIRYAFKQDSNQRSGS
jgi:diadenosine tetraphosphate (Ap4A) HIT family hydrolase